MNPDPPTNKTSPTSGKPFGSTQKPVHTAGEQAGAPKPTSGSEERWTIYVCRVCGYCPGNRRNWCNCGCGSDYNEMQAVEVVPAAERDSLQERLEEVERVGDLLQSSASRLAEWVATADAPYEVTMAGLEAAGAVNDWTEVRRAR